MLPSIHPTHRALFRTLDCQSPCLKYSCFSDTFINHSRHHGPEGVRIMMP